MSGPPEHPRWRRTWWLVWTVLVTGGVVVAGWQWGPLRLLAGIGLDVLTIGGTYTVFSLLLPGLPARLPHTSREIWRASSAVVVSLVTFVVVALWFVPLAWTLLVVGILTFPGLVHRRPAPTANGRHP